MHALLYLMQSGEFVSCFFFYRSSFCCASGFYAVFGFIFFYNSRLNATKKIKCSGFAARIYSLGTENALKNYTNNDEMRRQKSVRTHTSKKQTKKRRKKKTRNENRCATRHDNPESHVINRPLSNVILIHMRINCCRHFFFFSFFSFHAS